MRRYGRQGLLKHVRQGTQLAQLFAEKILLARYTQGVGQGVIAGREGGEGMPIFELACPVSLSLVCFRLNADVLAMATAKSNEVELGSVGKREGGLSEDDQRAFLARVKSSGKIFIIHTVLEGRVVFRLACGGSEQSTRDIERAAQVLVEEAGAMLNDMVK